MPLRARGKAAAASVNRPGTNDATLPATQRQPTRIYRRPSRGPSAGNRPIMRIPPGSTTVEPVAARCRLANEARSHHRPVWVTIRPVRARRRPVHGPVRAWRPRQIGRRIGQFAPSLLYPRLSVGKLALAFCLKHGIRNLPIAAVHARSLVCYFAPVWTVRAVELCRAPP